MTRARDRVLVELTISAPYETVWRSLRDPERIADWFGWDADTLADEIDFIFIKHAQASEADGVIRFEGVNDRFELERRGDGVVLRVVRTLPADDGWDDVFEEMTEGWIAFVQQLRVALEAHPGGRRRTIHLSGTAQEPGLVPSAALGLPRPAQARPGATVVAGGSPGSVSGEVWHATSHQVGVTVREWGDGLLVVLDKPDGGSLTLTTYGLDDAAFDAMQTRWKDWWQTRFAEPEKA
ncbi:hypothetical protein FKB34_02750 [Glycocaulis profundi]|nr:hypothetical protein FKB34_02750 [Glycocaulis profundi]